MDVFASEKTNQNVGILTTKVHGYKQIVVSNFLKDRYPFVEKKSNCDKENVDLSENETNAQVEVFKSVFFRGIQNLKSILINPNATNSDLQEVFLILNEKSSIQEEKINMIEEEIIEISFSMLNEYEGVLLMEIFSLLGSLFSIREGRKHIQHLDLKRLKPFILDENLSVRQNVSWMLTRIASGRDGVEYLVQQNVVKWIIQSFKKVSTFPIDLKETNYICQLLQTILEIIRDDHHIGLFIGQDFARNLNCLLEALGRDFNLLGKKSEEILLLCLDCLTHFAIDDQGKIELINANTIDAIVNHLDDKNTVFLNSTIRILMFMAIHPKGRKNIIDYQNHLLLKKFKQIAKIIDNNIRENLFELINTLSEDVLRFQKIFDAIPDE